MGKEFTDEDAELLDALGVESETGEQQTYTPLEERILAGFEDIERFYEEHGRLPRHGADQDIFERLYAIRLDRILALEDCLALLEPLDRHGIISEAKARMEATSTEGMSDDELLAALGVDDTTPEVSRLKHVKPRSEITPADEVARRERCPDFDTYAPIFEKVQQEIDQGLRRTVKFAEHAEVELGQLFIIEGQKAIVAGTQDEFVTDYDRKNRRLRVIYDNGTQANLLLRSLQRGLYRDPHSRRILDSDAAPPPLFSREHGEGDVETGHIYVVRSKSEDPYIAEHRELIHKIGMTKGDVKTRLSGARKDPTFLLADIEVMAYWTLSNINPTRLENLLHSFFAEARLDVKLRDRFGETVEPREWFMLPLQVINEALDLLIRGELQHYRYDAREGRLVAMRRE